MSVTERDLPVGLEPGDEDGSPPPPATEPVRSKLRRMLSILAVTIGVAGVGFGAVGHITAANHRAEASPVRRELASLKANSADLDATRSKLEHDLTALSTPATGLRDALADFWNLTDKMIAIEFEIFDIVEQAATRLDTGDLAGAKRIARTARPKVHELEAMTKQAAGFVATAQAQIGELKEVPR